MACLPWQFQQKSFPNTGVCPQVVTRHCNTSCPQTSQDLPRGGEPEIEPLIPGVDGLTFEDQHYYAIIDWVAGLHKCFHV